MGKKKIDLEFYRCRVLNNLTRWYRHLYGPTLPMSKPGRDALRELLVIISLGKGKNIAKLMRNRIETAAAWVNDTEEMIDEILRMPFQDRLLSMKTLKERVCITYQERLDHGIRFIPPCDKTEEELVQLRRERRNEMQRARGRRQKREDYEAGFANSETKLKPWIALGISRRTYYRRKKRDTGCEAASLQNGTGCEADEVLTTAIIPSATPEPPETPRGLQSVSWLERPYPTLSNAGGYAASSDDEPMAASYPVRWVGSDAEKKLRVIVERRREEYRNRPWTKPTIGEEPYPEMEEVA